MVRLFAIALVLAACRGEEPPVDSDPVLPPEEEPIEEPEPEPEPEVVLSTPGVGLTAGGGVVESPEYTGIITIGGSAPLAEVESTNYRARLGVGAANVEPETLSE